MVRVTVKTMTRNGATRYHRRYSKNCHQALLDIKNKFAGTKWIVVPFNAKKVI